MRLPVRRGAPSLRVLEFLILFCTVWFCVQEKQGWVLSSGVEATLTQHVSLQITDRTLTQLSIHCPKLQALVSQRLVVDLPLRDERSPTTLSHHSRNLLSGRVSSCLVSRVC